MIYVVCYVTLFPIQAFFTIILAGPFGLISAWLTVLQQSSSISGLLVAIVLLPEVQKIVFDAVLSREFKDDVVLIGKLRRVVKVPFLIKFGYSVFIVPQMLILPVIIVRVIFFLIIGSIPVVGPLIVILVQASSKGLQSHSRYFALKGFDSRQVKAIYRENTGQYMGFGIVANLLESIPVLNIFFMFTNAIGSGLWVVSIEEKIAKKGS